MSDEWDDDGDELGESTEYPNDDEFGLTEQAWEVVNAARRLLSKISQSSVPSPRQLVGLGRLRIGLGRLPARTPGMSVQVSLSQREQRQGEASVSRGWSVQMNDDELYIDSGGIYRGAFGSDSFTCLQFFTGVGRLATLEDYSSVHSRLVASLGPFAAEVAAIDPDDGTYILSVEDDSRGAPEGVYEGGQDQQQEEEQENLLPESLRDHRGLRFEYYCLPTSTDPCVCLMVLEGTEFARQLAEVGQMVATVASGAISTPYGPVLFVILCFFRQGKRIAVYESFLDPRDNGTRRLLETLASQKTVHVPVYDAAAGRRTALFEYGAVFDFQSPIRLLDQLGRRGPGEDFDRAREAAIEACSLEDLLKASDAGP